MIYLSTFNSWPIKIAMVTTTVYNKKPVRSDEYPEDIILENEEYEMKKEPRVLFSISHTEWKN